MSHHIKEEELAIKIPSGLIISGPSLSGKTSFLLELLKHYDEMFSPPPSSTTSILYCYGQYHQNVPWLESQGIRTCPGL